MNNLGFACESVYYVKNIDAEEKLLLKKLNEAFAAKNLEKFKMLLQRPIRKSLAHLIDSSIYDPKSYENRNSSKRFKLFRMSNSPSSTSLNNEFNNLNLASTRAQKMNNNEQQISQRILCYRKTNDDYSLLEKIMREADSSEFISFVWSECGFWRDSSALHAISNKGMCLMDHVIESCDDVNLFTFLIHDLRDKNGDKNYFLKIKNEIYTKKSGVSIFNKIYGKIQTDESSQTQCLIILNEILKEMKEIVDIRREVKVDSVLAMSDEKIQQKLLRILIKYWKVNSKDYHYYRNAFCEISPFYKLFLCLKEHDEDDFEDTFPEYLDHIRQICGVNESFNVMLQDDSNILLTLALDMGMRKAMQILISCQSASQSSFDFSINNEGCMLKLLEKGEQL